MDTLLTGEQGLDWTQAVTNECDQLGDGKLGKVNAAQTVTFIK